MKRSIGLHAIYRIDFETFLVEKEVKDIIYLIFPTPFCFLFSLGVFFVFPPPPLFHTNLKTKGRGGKGDDAHTAPISCRDMETIRSEPIGGFVQKGRYLRGRGIGGKDFGEKRGVISPTGFEEELTGGSSLFFFF